MLSEELKALVLSQPEVAAWPQMGQVAMHALSTASQLWEWPVVACQSVGGSRSAALPGAAAAFLMLLSISLVDDMLDADPRGAHQELGMAETANLALAFQATAFRVLGQAHLHATLQAQAADCLSDLALSTAYGQSLTTHEPDNEAQYWKVLRAKSAPFYRAVLRLGAILGDAPASTLQRLSSLGELCGEIAQLHDDLKDAFQVPSNPDWRHGRNNLLILYALTADYPERERFVEWYHAADEPTALHAAQQILIRCGAVSYATFQIARRYRLARRLLPTIPLSDPTLLANVLERQALALDALLAKLKLGPLARLTPV